jgi:4-hydroxythreonine-4-phosphate dehydrogenase
MNQSLIRDFGIQKPRIAVLAVNPHAGDNGLIGDEDNTILKPAIEKAYQQQTLVFGPYPADGFFGSGTFHHFDGILAVYHDQGLIPFKLLSFDEGVNFTAGLPFVRTSPAHGTAYEIAGKNEANPDAFRNAVYLACTIFNNRLAYDELAENALNHKPIQPESSQQ